LLLVDNNNQNEEQARLNVLNHGLEEPPINRKDHKLVMQLKREHDARMIFDELTLNRSERLRIIEVVMTYGLDEDRRTPWKRANLIHQYVKTGLPPQGA
jgi:hypothetical protein